MRRWQATHSPLMTMLKATKLSSYEGGFVPFVDLCQPWRLNQTFADQGLNPRELGRWTSTMSRFQIPNRRLRGFNLVVVNHKPVSTQVVVTSGGNAQMLTVQPGVEVEIEISDYLGDTVTVWAECHNPATMRWNADDRNLGIYCKGIRLNTYQ